MLTRRPSLNTGAISQTSQPRSKARRWEFLGSGRHQHSSDGGSRKVIKRESLRASTESRKTGRASLAYVRSLSKGQKTPDPTSGVNRSATDVEKLHVIPYSELILRRKLDGGLSLIEASECGDESVCWEEAWKLYMQKQAVNLRELSSRMEACSLHQNCTAAHELPSQPSHPISCPELPTHAIIDTTTFVEEEAGQEEPEKKASFLPNLWKQRLGNRRTRSLVLLNVLAALYGSSTVAGKFASDVAPGLPASLSSLVRFSSALLVFLPAAINVIRRDKNAALLKAGAELGGLLFAATVLETCGDGGASSDAPLLFAFTVIFVPIMELCAGRQSVRNITRIASLVALSGMGVLEEEGFGWKGISLPQVGDLWGLAASAVYALHIFRSEAHSGRFQPFQLTAIQCGTVASLSLLWEISRAFTGNTSAMEYIAQLQSLPWAPLVYSGLVCAGLCSWLEIRGLRSVHASTATMINTTIPIWGAFLSFFLRGEALDDSAIVGGSVILAASLFAQVVSKQDDTDTPTPTRSMARPRTESTPADAKLSAESGRILERSSFAKHVDHVPENSATPNPKPVSGLPAADHVQGAIITSQLKFPYYAAQAKRLLVEAKLKLLSVKSLVMSATSSMLMTTPPGPPGAVHSAASTAITASASLQQAVNVVNNGASSSSSFQVPVGGAPATVAVLQWLDAAAAVLESAAMAVGSDIVQAVEAAEDVGTVVEQAVHKAVEHMALVASSAEFLVGADLTRDMADLASLDLVKALDGPSALGVNSLNCVLSVLAHHTDAIGHIFIWAGLPNV